MSVFKNLRGTVLALWQHGIGGPSTKAESGTIAIRNAADDAYAELRASLVRVFGDDVVLNAGAAGSGADWTMTLERPDTGMTTNIRLIMPTGVPTPDDEIYVVSYSTGVVTLGYRASGAGATNQVHVDETDLAFGSSSPLAMVTKPANGEVVKHRIVIVEPFDGTPTVSIGIAGETSKYAAASHIDLTAAAGTVFELDPGEEATGGTEDIIATYSAGSATEGSARLQTYFAIPS